MSHSKHVLFRQIPYTIGQSFTGGCHIPTYIAKRQLINYFIWETEKAIN